MIPIVLVRRTNSFPLAGNDPVEAGLIESLARPGANVTGLTNLVGKLGGKRLELLKEAVPKVARVAVIYEPATPANVVEVKEDLPSAARTLKLAVQTWEIRDAAGFDTAFAALSKQRPDGLYVAGSPLINANQKRIADFALKSRLPSVYGDPGGIEAGALMYYGADLADSYRRVAYYVDRILKGAKPADLPVEQPTKFELVINLKTAKQIGVTIPQSLLYRAESGDEVRRRECQVSRHRVERAEKNMRRKITVVTLCAMLFALCLPAEAQQTRKVSPHRLSNGRLPFRQRRRSRRGIPARSARPWVHGGENRCH